MACRGGYGEADVARITDILLHGVARVPESMNIQASRERLESAVQNYQTMLMEQLVALDGEQGDKRHGIGYCRSEEKHCPLRRTYSGLFLSILNRKFPLDHITK